MVGSLSRPPQELAEEGRGVGGVIGVPQAHSNSIVQVPLLSSFLPDCQGSFLRSGLVVEEAPGWDWVSWHLWKRVGRVEVEIGLLSGGDDSIVAVNLAPGGVGRPRRRA